MESDGIPCSLRVFVHVNSAYFTQFLALFFTVPCSIGKTAFYVGENYEHLIYAFKMILCQLLHTKCTLCTPV